MLLVMSPGGTRLIRPRLDSLTSLRFLAAALVLVHHLTWLLMPGSLLSNLTATGFIGVGFFFALSGFVLMWTFDPSLPIRNFYGRRVARIGPVHLGTAALAVILIVAGGGAIAVLPAVTNVLLVQTWVPLENYGASLNAVSWSLCCEAFFYLCFPFIARAASKWQVRSAGVAIAAVIVASAVVVIVVLPPDFAQQLLFKNPLFRMGGFTLGILLAVAIKRGYRSPVTLPCALGVAAVFYAGTLAVSFIVDRLGFPALRVYADLIFLPAALILIAAAATGDLSGKVSWIQHPTLVRLGEASFALYMTHYLIFESFVRMFGVTGPTLFGYVISLVLCVVAVAASLVVYKFVEHPAERFIRSRIGTRILSKRADDATPDPASAKLVC